MMLLTLASIFLFPPAEPALRSVHIPLRSVWNILAQGNTDESVLAEYYPEVPRPKR